MDGNILGGTDRLVGSKRKYKFNDYFNRTVERSTISLIDLQVCSSE